MVEFYKEVSRFRADINHAATGEMIDFEAIVYEGPNDGQFSIRYSHTYKPTPDAGLYYSNTSTRAESADHAEHIVRGWAESIAESPEYGTWVNLHGDD